MTPEKLKEVLENHALWLENKGGECANLHGANLRNANLSNANLHGANLIGVDLDYSCWPLWCGSTAVKADATIVGQLMFHAFELAKSSGVEIKSLDDVRMLIDKGSPIKKHKLKNPLEVPE